MNAHESILELRERMERSIIGQEHVVEAIVGENAFDAFVQRLVGRPEFSAKVMKHVQWYSEYFSAVTGRSVTPEDLITMSEAVYNFQRIFNLKMGFGRREHDVLPYRAMGPVTELEYESRAER